MKRLRQGMLLADRAELRAEILGRQLSLAYLRAAEYGLSAVCREAMRLSGGEDPGRVRRLHETCGQEDPMGLGCLCQCHDVRDTAVVSGCSG